MRKILNTLLVFSLAISVVLSSSLPVQSASVLIGLASEAGALGGTTANYVYFQKFTASYSGTMDVFRVYSFSGGHLKVGIYSDVGGTPTTLMASSNSTAVNALAWNSITVAPSATIVAGTSYWLAALSDTTGGFGQVSMIGTGLQVSRLYANGLFTDTTGLPWAGYTTVVMIFQGCTSNASPSVTTSAATNVLSTSATLNGSQIADNNSDTQGFVWAAVTHTDPGNVAPASSAYQFNWTESGSYAPGSTFSYTPINLLSSTPYYFRAAAHNANGWAYGTELTFTTGVTIVAPSITIAAASAITTISAQLNATVSSNGGQLADVRFAYDNVTHANFTDYANLTGWVNDTFNTGDTASYSASGLLSARTYYFRAQVRNDAGTSTSDEMTLLTANSVMQPSNISAIPSSTSISVSWTKGSGANNTAVRYRTGSYPATTADGTLTYLGTGNSVNITGLTPGLTYYIALWGYTSGTYSNASATALITTTAYGTAATTTNNIEVPATNNMWTQTPSQTKVENLWFAPLVKMNIDAFNVPDNMGWYFGFMIVGLAIGIVLYNRAGQGGYSSYNLPMALGADIVWFSVGAILGLTMLWVIVFLLVLGSGFILFGHRH